MPSNSGEGDGTDYDEVGIVIAYGHPSGAVQASHPDTGLKQLGGTPAEAVSELWHLLEEGGVVDA